MEHQICRRLFSYVAWFGHININAAAAETNHTTIDTKLRFDEKKNKQYTFQLLIFSMWNDDKISAHESKEAMILRLTFSSGFFVVPSSTVFVLFCIFWLVEEHHRSMTIIHIGN